MPTIRLIILILAIGSFFVFSYQHHIIIIKRDSDKSLYDNDELMVYFKSIVLETGNIVWGSVQASNK